MKAPKTPAIAPDAPTASAVTGQNAYEATLATNPDTM